MKIWKSLRILVLIASGLVITGSALAQTVAPVNAANLGQECVTSLANEPGTGSWAEQCNICCRNKGINIVRSLRTFSSEDENVCNKSCNAGIQSLIDKGKLSKQEISSPAVVEKVETVSVDATKLGRGCADIAKDYANQEPVGYWGERCDRCCNRQPINSENQGLCSKSCRSQIQSEMDSGKLPKKPLDPSADAAQQFKAGASCARSNYKPTVSMETVCKQCCKISDTSANSGNLCMNGCRAVYTKGVKEIGVTCGKAKSATECSQCCSTQFEDADLNSACKTFAKCSAIQSETSDTAPKGSNMTPSCDAAYTTCMSKPGHTGCQKARTDCNANARKAAVVAVPPAANVGRVQAAQNCNKTFQACKKGAKGAALQACNQAKASCIKAIP